MNYRRFAPLAIATLVGYTTLIAQPSDPPLPAVFTMSEAVRTALQRNLAFRLDSINLVAAEATVRSRFGSFLPTISLNGRYSKLLNDVSSVADGVQLSASRPSTDLSGGAVASLQLFDGFGRSAAYNASRIARDGLELQHQANRVAIALEAREAFLDVLRGRSQEEVRRKEMEDIQTRLDRLVDRVEAGVALAADVDAVQAELATSEYGLLSAETATAVRLTRLLTVMNLSAERSVDVVVGSVDIRLDSTTIDERMDRLGDPTLFREKMLAERYDIAVKRSSLLEAEQRVRVARAGYYPSVGATLGVNHYRSGPITQTSGTLGIGLQYELFDGFRTDEQVELANASVLAARVDLRRSELAAERSLITIRASLRNAEKLVAAANRGVEAARISRESAVARYDAGVGTYESLLASTSRFVISRINLIDASYAWWVSYYQLVAQLGYVYEP